MCWLRNVSSPGIGWGRGSRLWSYYWSGSGRDNLNANTRFRERVYLSRLNGLKLLFA
jgi:hypothetical protein